MAGLADCATPHPLQIVDTRSRNFQSKFNEVAAQAFTERSRQLAAQAKTTEGFKSSTGLPLPDGGRRLAGRLSYSAWLWTGPAELRHAATAAGR